jgi:hypothetical protein
METQYNVRCEETGVEKKGLSFAEMTQYIEDNPKQKITVETMTKEGYILRLVDKNDNDAYFGGYKYGYKYRDFGWVYKKGEAEIHTLKEICDILTDISSRTYDWVERARYDYQIIKV